MGFQYALECSIKGNNPDIKRAISIQFINPPPPLICERSSHASIAQGNFKPRFIISDSGEKQATVALTELACNYKERKAEKFKITRYSMMEGEAVKDYEIEFNSHYLKISLMDCGSEMKNHEYELVASKPRSEILHTAYKFGDPSSSMKATAYLMEFVRADSEGQGLIVPDSYQ
jgi:hypothetical protein